MLDQNEPLKSPLPDQGFDSLMKDIYRNVDYFQMDVLEKYQEPVRYPPFDFAFLRSISNPASTSSANRANSASLSYSRASMTKIRVDPPVLQNCSQEIRACVSTLSSVSGNINSCANGAPSYDGQFGPRIRTIAGEVISRGGQLSGVINDLSGWLGRKAQQFLDVDMAFSGALNSIISNNKWLPVLEILVPPLSIFPFLSTLEHLFPNGIKLWNLTPGNTINPGQSFPPLNTVKPNESQTENEKTTINSAINSQGLQNYGNYGQTFITEAPNDLIYQYTVDYKKLQQITQGLEDLRNDNALDGPVDTSLPGQGPQTDAFSSALSKIVGYFEEKQLINDAKNVVVKNENWTQTDFLINEEYKKDYIKNTAATMRWDYNSTLYYLYQHRDDQYKAMSQEDFIEFGLLPQFERALIEEHLKSSGK